jgi:hypothetical protein
MFVEFPAEEISFAVATGMPFGNQNRCGKKKSQNNFSADSVDIETPRLPIDPHSTSELNPRTVHKRVSHYGAIKSQTIAGML